jgi:hypothetical protein
MAAPNVTLDGDELTIEINKGNKQWVAEIGGKNAQYDLDRNFVSPYGQDTETITVKNGDIIERVYYSHSGNERGRVYWIVHEGELVEIKQDNVKDALENPEHYYPEPETHECDECGDEFDSEHGLAVHQGIKHSDDEETEGTEETTMTESNSNDTSAATMTDGGQVEVEYDGQTIAVPTTFRKRDLDNYYGSVPETCPVEYIYTYDGRLRAEGQTNETTRVVATYRPDLVASVGSGWGGWTAKLFDSTGGVPPNTLWERDNQRPSPTDHDDNGPEPMTDGGVVADSGDETDWDLVAGDEPGRNGTRRIVDDDARTTYKDSGTYYDELFGIDMEIGSRYSDDTITYVNVCPQSPKRARRATGTGWIARLAVGEGDYDALYADGDADDPLPGYQAETTGDYRDTDPEDPRGDGVYVRDDADSALTAEIADVVTREGGRIPVEFSAVVQNEGYARSRKWRVYAPAHNPYHVAAAVTDLLRDADGVSEVHVHVSDKSASQIAQRLRATGIGFIFDRDNEADCIERSLRELRWESGLPAAQQRILQAVPSEARERAQEADFDDQLTDYDSQLRTLHQRPGDAWGYHEVNIRINEEAADPYYG